RIGSYLGGLEHHDDEPLSAQLGHNGLLVAAAGLDANPLYPMPPQPINQCSMALSGIIDQQPFGATGQRDIELALGGIDAGTDHGRLAHLRRPFLECEPSVPSTIRVPMKCRSRSCYADSPRGLGGQRSDRSAARLGWPPGPGHSSWNDAIVLIRANTGQRRWHCIAPRKRPSYAVPTQLLLTRPMIQTRGHGAAPCEWRVVRVLLAPLPTLRHGGEPPDLR